jgi:Fe-S cluster assembly protein SufD
VTAEPRSLRTKAEEALAAQYKAAADGLPGGDAVRRRRDAAMALFERSGLPHRRVEAWKYTDLRALMKSAAPLAGDADEAVLARLLAEDTLAGLDRARIVIVNGYYRPDLSDLAGADGVTVASLAGVLAKNPDHVGQLFEDGDDVALMLNSALMQGGVVVDVAKGAKPRRAIEIVHIVAAREPVAAFSRDVVSIGANASVRIVESYRGPARQNYQVNAVTELAAGQGAKVEWARLQTEGDGAQHIGTLAARLSADVTLNHLSVNAGGALWRWQGFTTIAGRGVTLGYNGATMLKGREHGDQTLVIEHAEGHSQSRERFKSVVDDDAEGVFQGRIVVQPDAQKTDGKMMTQALLLSESAQFAAKPELEIFADDVQCGHGATSGRIDDTQLFYLMARGVPRPHAEQLLIEAFLDDAIDSISDEALATSLKGVVSAWLRRRGERSAT